jgi:hypothetical protein
MKYTYVQTVPQCLHLTRECVDDSSSRLVSVWNFYGPRCSLSDSDHMSECMVLEGLDGLIE